MSNANITLHGSVPLEVGGKEILSLTGSAIILEIGGNKILTDLGLFQGGEGAELFNTTNVDFLKDIDSVIITHPHVDHVGRIPLLFKYGFRGPIYMTPAARKITKEMLLDCFKIQEGEKIERVRRNNKLGFRLREALKIKQGILALKKNKFTDKQEKQSIELFINKKLGKGLDRKDALNQISDYLNFYLVKEEEDIGRVINELNQTLFSEDEMYGAIGLIQSSDYSEEKIISSKKISSKNNNAENQDVLNNLPERVSAGFKSEISVDFKSEKRKLRALWDKKLKEEIKRVFDSNLDIEEQKNTFKKELEAAYIFCNQSYAFLEDKDNSNVKDFKTHPEYRGIEKHMQKYKKLLEKYNIRHKDDIQRLIENDELLIDIFKIDIPFCSGDIEKAVHLLKVKNESNNKRKVIGLTLTDAAHVVGSASVNLIAGEVKGRVNNIMDINGNAISVCLSGDLGRIKYNRLGKPELPAFPVNHLQIESTYASKEHRDRDESVKDLVDSIEKSKGNVLISVFAQHRLQEILMTLLEAKAKDKTILDYEILIDAPLGEKLTDIYVEYEGEIFNLLDENVQKEIFGKVVFRFLGEGDWEKIYNEEVEKPDVEKIKENVIKNNKGITKEELDILIKKAIKDKQEEIKLNNKHIILASSGMMEGGAILNHLPKILDDADATILSPGFLCNGTLGNDIVIAGKKVVTVNGEKYGVKCNTKFIDGFSSHISHSEILEYISEAFKKGKFKLDSTISLNHGMREGQELLKKDIEEILKNFDRTDIKVIIPEMFDSYLIEERKISKKKKKQNIKSFTVVKGDEKGAVPSFLLGTINLEKEPDEITESEDVISKRKENQDIISNFQNLYVKIVGKIVKDKKLLIGNFLISVLEKFKNNKLFNFLGEISKLGEWQSKSFYDSIDKKIDRNRGKKSYITSQKNKIKNIDIIKILIVDFKYDIDHTYTEEQINLENEINTINDEILELVNSFKSFKESTPIYNKDYINNYKSFEKQILSKKSRIIYLKRKIQELNYLITGKTDNLEKEIEILKIKIGKERIDFEEFKTKKGVKNKENRAEWDAFSERILFNRNKIKQIAAKIEKIKNKRINYENRLKSNIPDKFHKKLKDIFTKLWDGKDENNISLIEELCFESILDLKSDIEISIGELESHITTYFKPREQSFEGRNIYSELFESRSGDINLDKIQQLLNNNQFSDQDKKFIENILEEYNRLKKEGKAGKKQLGNPIKKLRKFFKSKQSANNDLGINLEVSIEDINNEALNILSQIFEKKYYDEFIYVNFNIYLFLKSKEPFNKYIKRKYNLEKLKGFSDAFSESDKLLEDVDYDKDDLNNLLSSNSKATNIESLEQVDYGIANVVGAIKERVKKLGGYIKKAD